MTTSIDRPALVPAWDGPTRLFHWLLPFLVLSAWISYRYAESFGDVRLVWHRANGLTVLVLIVWRLLWGAVGSSTSRFSSFVRSPAKAFDYARALRAGPGPKYLGHNPLGAYAVLALLAALGFQASLGLFAIDENDIVGGPLFRLVGSAMRKDITELHEWNFFYIVLTLIAVHLAASLYYRVIKKESLITAMVTGKKPAADYADASEAVLVARPWWRAFVCLLAATAIVFGTILALGGRLAL